MTPNWFQYIKPLARCVIILLVIAGIAMFARSAWQDLQEQQFAWSELQPQWLLVGILSYSLGMVPFWLYWHLVLLALGQNPRLSESMRAHFVGHLGKYVPGKAMVVVLRTSLVKSDRTEGAVAAVAVFIETLSMMAVGAAMAAVCLLPSIQDKPGLFWLAIGLLIASGTPTLPPIFRRIVAILRVKKASPEIESKLLGLTWRVWGTGWLLLSLGWCGYGLSLFFALSSLPGPAPTIGDIPRLLGSAALAIVAGFISLIPAGMGVRELVLLPLLSGFGPARALLAVLLARVTWLVSELGLSAILYSLRPRKDSRELDDEATGSELLESASVRGADGQGSGEEVSANLEVVDSLQAVPRFPAPHGLSHHS